MSGIRVRPATVADAERIGAVHVAAWRETYVGLMPAVRLAALDVAERTTMWRRQLAGGTARGIAVVEDDDGIVGFAACARQRSSQLVAAGYSGEIPALYVLRAAQGRNAGRLLIQAMARRLIAEGECGMALWVLAANAPARGFYERMGGGLVGKQVNGEDDEVAYGWRDLAALAEPGAE